MIVGICTRYAHHEATFAALRLADGWQQRGYPVTLFTMTTSRQSIDPFWDRQVIRHTATVFTDWAANCDTVVWTAVPHREQLQWVQSQQKRAIILPLWHELTPDTIATLSRADRVLCPTANCFEMLQHYRLKNLVELLWDPGCPQFQKATDHVITPRVLLPLWDGHARRSEMTTLSIVERALQHCSELVLTVACSGSTIRAAALRRWRELRKRYAPRLTLRLRLDTRQRWQLFREHDLTLWPTHFENLNDVGLTSMWMGTPVIGFQFPPTDEILTTSNAIPVYCREIQVNEVGVPSAVPDYEQLDLAFRRSLCDTLFIQYLQQVVGNGLGERRVRFDAQLAAALA